MRRSIKPKLTVGILGGMGPAATANFLRLFTAELNLRGAMNDSDFPKTIVLNLPLNDFGVAGAEDKNHVARQVADGVNWLLRQGADIVAVPCNSVHEFYPFGAKEGQVLNIVEETLKRCDDKVWRLGVLCSRQTLGAQLYEADNGSIAVTYGHQEMTDITIAKVMMGETPNISDLLNGFSKVDAVVLGCTELSLCHYVSKHRVIDSSQSLAEALANAVA